MRVIVIGAGLGGLSAAAHLAAAGQDVTVIEREARPGGRAGVIREEGFSLDTGPTVLTMPHVLREPFEVLGRDPDRYMTLSVVDPMYRGVFADGSELRLRAGHDAMRDEIARFAGDQAAGGFTEFCAWLTKLFELQMPKFVETDYDSSFDLIRKWRSMVRLARYGGFGRMDEKVAAFFDDERLQRIFSFQSLYAGLAPHSALALYSMTTYMDVVGGVYAPQGGVFSLASGLSRALRDAGVTMRYSTAVNRVLRRGDGAVAGVELENGERLVADAVVCNVDLPVAYRTLFGGVEAPRVARRGTYSPSCVLWVAGVRGTQPNGVVRHNLHFGDAWEESFRQLTRRGVRMSDPSILVGAAAVDDPSVAPEGCTTLYVIEPVPNLDGRIDWARHSARIRDELRARVTELGYPTDDVVVERWYDPLDWEAMGLERGSPFSLAHTWRQSGPFRPRNVDDRIAGLVFTGSATNPGVGVPMVMLSGRFAADRVARYERDTRVLRW